MLKCNIDTILFHLPGYYIMAKQIDKQSLYVLYKVLLKTGKATAIYCKK